MSDLLDVDNLFKTWDPTGPSPVPAVRGACLKVAPGETIVVTGPSGSGKTTLLSMLGGLVRPDAGHVRLEGIDLTRCSAKRLQEFRLRQIGFVFQRGLLLENLTARQNITTVLRAAGMRRASADHRADELLDRMGLSARADFLPRSLSPGEGQRVAVARALSMAPKLVLADEPTAHLDRANGDEVAVTLRTMTYECGAGCVVVTHDPRIHTVADRVFSLEDGRLVEMDPSLPTSGSEIGPPLHASLH